MYKTKQCAHATLLIKMKHREELNAKVIFREHHSSFLDRARTEKERKKREKHRAKIREEKQRAAQAG
jgi:hypothetical protein